jgi:hypothetical protein
MARETCECNNRPGDGWVGMRIAIDVAIRSLNLRREGQRSVRNILCAYSHIAYSVKGIVIEGGNARLSLE